MPAGLCRLQQRVWTVWKRKLFLYDFGEELTMRCAFFVYFSCGTNNHTLGIANGRKLFFPTACNIRCPQGSKCKRTNFCFPKSHILETYQLGYIFIIWFYGQADGFYNTNHLMRLLSLGILPIAGLPEIQKNFRQTYFVLSWLPL